MRRRIYIYKSGSLIRQDNSLIFETNDSKEYLPIYQLEAINIFNHCNFNKNTIILLNRYNIILNIFDYNGNYNGSFIPNQTNLGIDIIKQVEFIKDDSKKLQLAIEMTLSSLINMEAVIKYYNKKYELTEKINILNSLKDKILESKDINNLLTIEAKAKQEYYSCFDIITINHIDFKFQKRSTRPPENMINAMMSFGYSLLYTLIRNTISRSHLNINLPIIHGVTRSPEGLQYDIADIFKPIIIDRTIFRMINRLQIKKEDFQLNGKSVYLNKTGMEKYISEYEELLKSTIKLPNNKTLTYRSLITNEVHKISNHILKQKKYLGYKHKW